MSIGSTIKKLRREKDLTQEELASFLNISAQAVSQWECDKSSPDLSQIPILVNIFDVSADVLLEIDNKKAERELKDFFAEYSRLGSIGENQKQFDLTEAMYRKYPNNFEVMEKYIWQLFYDPACQTEPFGEKVHCEKLRELCDLIIRECPIQSVRLTAYDVLSVLYLNEGNVKMAEKICSQYPESYFDVRGEQFEQIYARTDGEKYVRQMKQNLMAVTEHLVNKLRNLGTFGMAENRAKIRTYEKCLSIIDCMYDDAPNGFARYHKGTIACMIARILLFGEGDFDAGLSWMRQGLADCHIYDEARSLKQTEQMSAGVKFPVLDALDAESGSRTAAEESTITHTAELFAGIVEDMNDISTSTKENRVAYELSEFQKAKENADGAIVEAMPAEYDRIWNEYAVFAGRICGE